MLNDKDIQKLKKVLTTKEDLERFATKEDLDEKSNKLLEEIFSTREDFESFRDEVRKSFSELHSAIYLLIQKRPQFPQFHYPISLTQFHLGICFIDLLCYNFYCSGGGTVRDLADHPESSGCESPHLHYLKLNYCG